MSSKRILVIGNGGREHAIIEALSRSPQSPTLFNLGTAINPGIENLCEAVIIGDIMNNQEIKKIASELNLDFAIVGPDDPIGNGAADALKEIGIKSFAYFELEDYTNAVKYYELYLEKETKYFERLRAQWNLSLAYRKLGNTEAEEKILEAIGEKGKKDILKILKQ